jgi:hypothetical protein
VGFPRIMLPVSRGGAGFGAHVPPPFIAAGPYDPGYDHSALVLTQVHCHTTSSDGSYSPGVVVADYLGKGYGALAITDHDKVTSQPAGITTAIVANELSPSTQHIISMGSSYVRGTQTVAQSILDGIEAAGGVAEIAHPKWYIGMTYDEMRVLTGYLGHEIHNMHCLAGAGRDPVSYPTYALDRWDQLLVNVRRNIWGFAVDDLHSVNTYETFDVGRLRVWAPTNNLAGVLGGIVGGHFVADVSNYGVTPGFPVRDDEGLSLSCTGAVRIEAWGAPGLLGAADASSLDYTYEGSEQYVRLVAIGDHTEPFDALSDRWRAVDGTWTVSGGTLHLSTDATDRRIILRQHREGDFTAKVDVKLSASGTDHAALMFNVLNNTYWYILRFGEAAAAGYNNKLSITRSNTLLSGPLAAYSFTATPGTWYTLSMAYTAATGLIEAKIWERGTSEPGSWQVSLTDTSWRTGAFGFRAVQQAEFDNLYIKGFRTYYQPVAIDPG